jgi:hypothetical protein
MGFFEVKSGVKSRRRGSLWRRSSTDAIIRDQSFSDGIFEVKSGVKSRRRGSFPPPTRSSGIGHFLMGFFKVKSGVKSHSKLTRSCGSSFF